MNLFIFHGVHLRINCDHPKQVPNGSNRLDEKSIGTRFVSSNKDSFFKFGFCLEFVVCQSDLLMFIKKFFRDLGRRVCELELETRGFPVPDYKF
jgi:hypothetical protein